MKPHGSLLVSAVFLVVAVVTAVWLYPHLPAQVPVRWDYHNHVVGTMPRFWAAAYPALSIAVWVLLSWLLPAISPRQFAIKPFVGVWGILMLALQGYCLVVTLAVLLKGAGHAVSIPMVVMLAVGMLLVVRGNYMGKLRKNFFAGIRTPWTLASDAVWERTHYFARIAYMVGGLAIIATGLIHPLLWILPVVIAAVLLSTTAYSYFMHLSLEGSR